MQRFPFASQHMSIGATGLQAFLDTPDDPRGLVIFVHEHGRGRNHVPDNHVAAHLRRFGYATLLLDLLSPAEEHAPHGPEREPLLAARIGELADWARSAHALKGLGLHWFGSGDIAGPLLQALSASDGAFGRIVLFEPVLPPAPGRTESPLPLLVIAGPETASANPAATVVTLAETGEARFHEAAQRAAEWFGAVGDELQPVSAVPAA